MKRLSLGSLGPKALARVNSRGAVHGRVMSSLGDHGEAAPHATTKVRMWQTTWHPPKPIPTHPRLATLLTKLDIQPVVNHPPKKPLDYRRALYATRSSLGATAIEYGTVPISPPPPPPKQRAAIAARSRSRAIKLATAFQPDALKFTPDAYAFGDAESDWRDQMLTETKSQTAWLERWVKRDELQRYIQIGATLAIPLAAAVWRAIFRAARRGG